MFGIVGLLLCGVLSSVWLVDVNCVYACVLCLLTLAVGW